MTPSAAAAANIVSAAAAVVLFSSAASPDVTRRTAGRTRSGGTKVAGESGRCLLTITHGLVGSESECCGPGAAADGGGAAADGGTADEVAGGGVSDGELSGEFDAAAAAVGVALPEPEPRPGVGSGVGPGVPDGVKDWAGAAGGQRREARAGQQEAAEGPAARRIRAGRLPPKRSATAVVAHLC